MRLHTFQIFERLIAESRAIPLHQVQTHRAQSCLVVGGNWRAAMFTVRENGQRITVE
jgi:hypothetical protein